MQSSQLMDFRKITPHSQVCRNTFCLTGAYFSAHGTSTCTANLIYVYSAETRPKVKHVWAALSKQLSSDYLRIRQHSGISAE